MKKTLLLLLTLLSTTAFASDQSYLFLQTAMQGQLQSVGKNQYTLTLKHPKNFVNYFSNRPLRQSGQMDLNRFLAFWTNSHIKDNFKVNPPNAAITLIPAKGEPVNFIAVVSSGKYQHNKLTYTLTPEHAMNIKRMTVKEVDLFFDDIHWNPGGF